VNAIVGREITPPTSHGPGTDHAIAYCHESAANELRELLERELPNRHRIIAHSNNSLIRQVLIDLPDIDSHYSDHIQITRRMLRHILYPIWIQSIEKYADLAPQQLLARVAAGNDPANFIFCLNKIDQLSTQQPEAVTELAEDYARRLQHTLDLPQPPRVHLVSATHPHAADMPGLRAFLSREKSTQTVQRSQGLAARRRDRSLLGWLDQQRLEERVQRLARLQEQAEQLLADRVGQPLLEQALPRIVDDPGQRMAMVEPAMQKRLSRWPAVNVLDALLSPLLGLLRINLSSAAMGGSLSALDLDTEARTTASRVQSVFAQLHQTQPVVGELYRHRKLWEEPPAAAAIADLQQRLAATIQLQRDAAAVRAAGASGIIRPLVRWTLTIGAVLWFPFVQPLLEAWLQPGFGKTTQELLLLGVQMIGVTYLLKNVTFLLIWFLALWMILRYSTHRRVNRLVEIWRSSVDPQDPLSLTGQTISWMDDLIEPIRAQRERTEAVVRRIEVLRASLNGPVPSTAAFAQAG
jgi:hypothetical protein